MSTTQTFSAEDLGKLDFSRLLKHEEENEFLRAMRERARAAATRFIPLTIEERFEGFRKIGFHPHGVFLPELEEANVMVRQELSQIGALQDADQRLLRYFELQQLGDRLEQRGIKGTWTGQQGVARSQARFRLVAWGRRGGKTIYAAHEAVGVALVRPGTRIWLVAPINRLVARAWEYIEQVIDEGRIEPRIHRNTTQERQVTLANGSKIEGISAENVMSMAGEAIDLAVVDEAAQILPDAFYRGILPPLADREGQVLLISSFEGEGDFFSTQLTKVEAELAEYRSKETDMLEEMPDLEWEMFQAPSYDVNFFAFPQGRRTRTIQVQERNMPVEEFAEQYGAVPMGARERVYREFSEKIHVGDFPFDPDVPVHLVADPSGGINEYAVLVVQDHHDYDGPFFTVVDEFYEVSRTAEQIAPILRARPWIANVVEMIVDQGAAPDEPIRWSDLGFPAVPIPDKPDLEESIPLVRNMLRNPDRYYWLTRDITNRLLVRAGKQKDADFEMGPAENKKLLGEVLEEMRPENNKLLSSDLDRLRGCSRIFIDVQCESTIDELKMYRYQKKRALNRNYRETPQDFKNHLMDCLRYYVWAHYRHELSAPVSLPRSYVGPASGFFSEADLRPMTPSQGVEPRVPGTGFLPYLRELYGPSTIRGRSYLAAS